MKANEAYFKRLHGAWQWTAEFRIKSWMGLWTSPIRWPHKLRVIGMLLSQRLFGKLSLWTRVEFQENSQIVRHSLKLTSWGVPFYRSEKRISLDTDGFGLLIDGEEYFWPTIRKPITFSHYQARVSELKTSANYRWPLFEFPFPCETRLGNGEGFIRLDAEWLECLFQMTDRSLEELNRR